MVTNTTRSNRGTGNLSKRYASEGDPQQMLSADEKVEELFSILQA